MKAVLVFDADNTLWDTNSVFRGAQLALLEKVHHKLPSSKSEELLRTLRALDSHLANRLGTFEYDFRILSLAAAYLFSRSFSSEKAAEEALLNRANTDPGIEAIAREAFRAYSAKLLEIPHLFPDTKPVLSSLLDLRKNPKLVFTILLSEGDPKRLRRILRAYNMDGKRYFDQICIRSKSRDVFNNAWNVAKKFLPADGGQRPLKIAIGDSIQRDIRFANEAGFLTVYKPSGYKGFEEPRDDLERPTYRIEKLAELQAIFANLGLPLKHAIKLQT